MDCLIRNIVEEPLNTVTILVKKLQKSVDELNKNIETIKSSQQNIMEMQEMQLKIQQFRMTESSCHNHMLERIQSGSLGC